MNKLSFHHYHEGNDPHHEIRPRSALYSTQARIVEVETGKTLVEVWAHCSPKDVPRRELGREVAGGRALAEAKKIGIEWPVNAPEHKRLAP